MFFTGLFSTFTPYLVIAFFYCFYLIYNFNTTDKSCDNENNIKKIELVYKLKLEKNTQKYFYYYNYILNKITANHIIFQFHYKNFLYFKHIIKIKDGIEYSFCLLNYFNKPPPF